VQAAEGSEAANGDGDPARHASHDARIEKDPPTGQHADFDQRRPIIPSPAPTEPQVTNVTPASAAGVAVGDDEGIPGGVLVEPAPSLVVEDNGELIHHAIIARAAQ